MSEETKKPKFSNCPPQCKIGKLKIEVIDEIDSELAQGYTYEDIIQTFPLAQINIANLSVHKRKHMDMAKAALDLQEKGIKKVERNQTVEQETERLLAENPELAKEVQQIAESGLRPIKSMDVVTDRMKVIIATLGKLNSLDPAPHKLICSYEQVLQKWTDLYSRLTGEIYKDQKKEGEMTTVASFIIKDEEKKQGGT